MSLEDLFNAATEAPFGMKPLERINRLPDETAAVPNPNLP